MTDRELMQMALDSLELNNTMHDIFVARLLRERLSQPEQEPVAWIVDGEIKVRLDMAGKLYYSETNVYSAPPKREWAGLTDEERFLNDARSAEEIEYAKAIEAKLKERNNT